MSTAPIVGFFNVTDGKDLNIEETGWELGEIKANTESDELKLRIWNNRGGLTKEVTDEFVIEEEGDNLLNLTVSIEEEKEPIVYFVEWDSQEEEETLSELIKNEDFEINEERNQIILIGDYEQPEVSDHFRVKFESSEEVLASYMQNPRIEILDEDENQIKTLVTQGWIRGKCDSLGDEEMMILDDETDLVIGAENLTNEKDEPVISGEINNGTDEDTNNYADVSLVAKPPYNAVSGEQSFFINVRYYYT